MSAIVIYENDGTVSYTIGATPRYTAMPVDFPYFFNDEITVWHVENGVSTLLNETNHYTLMGLPADDGFSQGWVTLVTDVADVLLNCTIRIDRALRTEKAHNFPETGAISIPGMNTLFSRLFSLMQDLRRTASTFSSYINRYALRVPVGDEVTVVAPPIASRQGRYMAWDGLGGVTVPLKTVAEIEAAVETLWGGIGTIDVEEALSFATLGALQAFVLPSTLNFAVTKGRTVVGDQGGGTWIWIAGNQSALVSGDPGYGLYAPPTADLTGASGTWKRLFVGCVDPRWFGAIADGVVDDRIALRRALESGYIVDGGNRSYGIGAVCVPADVRGFRNATLKWLTPGVGKMLEINGSSGFFLQDIKIDMGNPVSVGNMNDNQGLSVINSTNFVLDRIDVYNGGPNNGLRCVDDAEFTISNCHVHDFYVDKGPGSDPQDDVIQLYFIVRCSNFAIVSSRADRAYVKLNDAIYRPADGNTNNPWVFGLIGNSTRWARGFVFTGCSLFSLSGCGATFVDQGFDITGSLGNSGFVTKGCYARSCATYGLKNANSSFQGNHSGFHADDCGLAGIVLSGGSGGTEDPPASGIFIPLTEGVHYFGCRVYNTGSDGRWEDLTHSAAPPGSLIRSYAVFACSDPAFNSYPRDIKYFNCAAVDRQAAPTTEQAYQIDPTCGPPGPITSGYTRDELNELINCSAYGIATFQDNFQAPNSVVRGNGTLSVVSGVPTVLNFINEVSDTGRMHNVDPTADLASKVFIRKTGFYDLRFVTTFVANATGIRRATIAISGGAADAIMDEKNNQGASSLTVCEVNLTKYLVNGDYVQCFAFHNVGANLDVSLDRSSLSVLFRA